MNTAEPLPETAPAKHPYRMSTRTLLACAAIGAAGGIVIAPISIFSSSGPALAMPLLYGALAMVKLLPGVLAQTMLRRPGVALLTCVIVGLVNIAFSAHGPLVLVSLAGVGLLQEIPVAALLYRRWNAWLLVAGNLLVGLVLAWLGWRILSTSATHPAVAAGYWGVSALGAVAVAWLGCAIGARVRQSGVVGAA